MSVFGLSPKYEETLKKKGEIPFKKEKETSQQSIWKAKPLTRN